MRMVTLHRALQRRVSRPFRQWLTGARLCRNYTTNITSESLPKALIDLNGNYRENQEALNTWRNWARSIAEKTIQEFKGSDQPTLSDLYAEIDWLIEDNVDAVLGQSLSEESVSKAISRNYTRVSSDHSDVLLRLSLSEMESLWLERLQSRTPLQYLTNFVYWRNLSLIVTPSVLIPRPETELMIDFATRAYQNFPLFVVSKHSEPGKQMELRGGPWLDLGTGSGALAIALAQVLLQNSGKSRGVNEDTSAEALVYAVDVSPDACNVARHNVHRHGLGHCVQVMTSFWFNALGTLQFSGILSNPPYIPSEQICSLQREVRDHEPILALDGGCIDGAKSLIEICSGAAKHLLDGGFLALETHGNDQAELIENLLHSMKCFTEIQVQVDYCGVKRFVTATKCIRFSSNDI